MSLIKGLHHVCMKCATEEEFAKVQEFYGTTLGLPVVRTWDTGLMYDLGGVLLEVFSNGTDQLPQGVWRHIALATDDVDACVQRVADAGYPITMAPRNIVVASQPPVPARIAFCTGPMGEEIEFFCEK